MEVIFHEKQQGSLCAQHCLNALLQGSYFTAVDLATIGHRMDEEERSRMAEAGVSSEEYNQFLQQPSSNVDDSGYFSVQVLSAALSVWGLELLPFNSSDPRAAAARHCPINESAFICHFRDHWFSIRKLGRQWFNLNSILAGPELLSDTYLSLFLAQLQIDKYSIFIVIGDLPNSEADKILSVRPLSPQQFRKQTVGSNQEYEDDDQLKAVLEMSRKELEDEDDREALNKAILQSLQSNGGEPTVKAQASVDEDDLKKAITMSLESEIESPQSSASLSIATATSGPESLEFIRQRRLLRLGQSSNNP